MDLSKNGAMDHFQGFHTSDLMSTMGKKVRQAPSKKSGQPTVHLSQSWSIVNSVVLGISYIANFSNSQIATNLK